MNEDPLQYAVMILAAEESSWMDTPMPLLPLGRKNILSHILSNPFLQRKSILPHVVLGHEPENILSYIPKEVPFSINERYQEGRTTSVQCGLFELPKNISGFFLLPVECPRITSGIFEVLMEAYSGEMSICIPSYQNKSGHPPLIGKAYFDEIAGLKDDESVRSIYQRHEDQIIHVPVESDAILHTIHSPKDYERMLSFFEKEGGEL